MNGYLMSSLIILAGVLWVWAIYDLNKTRSIEPHKRTFWLMSLYILPIIGPITYFQVKRKYITKRKDKLNLNNRY